ncbi:hypothetical protein [Bradyrhizobium daqingense]
MKVPEIARKLGRDPTTIRRVSSSGKSRDTWDTRHLSRRSMPEETEDSPSKKEARSRTTLQSCDVENDTALVSGADCPSPQEEIC